MNKKIAYFYLVLFATHYASLHAAQDSIVAIHQLSCNNSCKPLPLDQQNTALQMSAQRKLTICEPLTNILPNEIENIVLQMAYIDSTEEYKIQQKYTRFRRRLKTLRNRTFAATAVTILGAIEFGVAANGNVSLSTERDALTAAYTSTALSGAAFVYGYLRIFCTGICVPQTKLSKIMQNITWDSIHGMLASLLALGVSCTPIVQVHAPLLTSVPLQISGTSGITFGPVLLARDGFDLCTLYKDREFSLKEFLTSHTANTSDGIIASHGVAPRSHDRSCRRCCCAIM